MLSNYVEVALLVRYTEWLLTFVFTKRLICICQVNAWQ